MHQDFANIWLQLRTFVQDLRAANTALAQELVREKQEHDQAWLPLITGMHLRMTFAEAPVEGASSVAFWVIWTGGEHVFATLCARQEHA